MRLLFAFLATWVCACTVHHRSGGDIPEAPWVQLERNSGAGADEIMWLELDGSYTGSRNFTATKGTLPSAEVAFVKELFASELLEKYRANMLPTDGSVSVQGSATEPVFRVVVRVESERILAGTEVLEVYLLEKNTNNIETTRLLDKTKGILQMGLGGAP